MKKYLFMALICFVGSTVYAQYGPQWQGATETATLVPALTGAAAGANTGLSIQNGDANKVRVRQAGTSQSAYTFQDNGPLGSGGNLAKIRQTGNVSAPSGIENAADVIQSGTTNQSNTRQEGDYNSAITKQGQNTDNSTSNRGFIRQGIANQAEENIAKLEQDGNDNQGTILQTSDSNDAWTVQSGDGNKSSTVQRAAPNGTPGHYAYTSQDGNNNENRIDQSGDNGQGNWAWAYQTGEANKSQQIQANADVLGSGFVNYAMVDQGAFQDGIQTADGNARLTALDGGVTPQLTSLNSVSENNIALQDQDGGDLDAETHQYGSDNYSEQNQTGSGNDAFIMQNTYGAGNYGRQDQFGTNSVATLGQFGAGNKAWQRQADDDNEVVSSQRGDNNLLNTYQDGDGNRGTTLQIGDENVALLVQRGGHSYAIEQIGTGNQADILQLGPNGDFQNDAIDCSFDTPQTWIPIPELPSFNLGDICPDC